jgi:hypothetical protein
MPIRTRCSPTSTSRGRSERCGESVDQVDHDRVRGLTVIGVRGRARRARAAGGSLARLAVVVGVLAGVVLGNGMHGAGGMSAMVIEHAGSSHVPAGIAQAVPRRGPSVLSRLSSPTHQGHCMSVVVAANTQIRLRVTAQPTWKKSHASMVDAAAQELSPGRIGVPDRRWEYPQPRQDAADR